MSSNTIKIKAGSGTPTTSDIQDKELAFDRSADKLYINDAGTIVDLTGTAASGDIEGVTAGNGLTGGGTSGTVTLNIGAGTGIDVAADAISVDVSDFMSNGANNRVLTATGTDAFRGEGNLTFDGSTLAVTGAITASSTMTVSGNLIADTLDVAGDITLDADGADIILKDGGTEFGRLSNFLGGLTLKTGSSSANGLIFSADGSTAIFGGGIQLSGSMTLDSVAVSAIQTSSESFADNNTSLMTSAAINDRIESFGYITTDTNTTYSAGTGLDLSGTTFSVDVSDFMSNGADNRVLTATGTDGINAESSLLFSGSTLQINNSGDWSYVLNNTNSGGLRLGTKDSGGTLAYQIELSNTGNYVKLNENTTVTGSLTVNGTVGGTGVKDEDNMSSNSATHLATQQSIKAYVDAEVAGIVNSAPAALDTLDELAAALGDDANFATTTSTSLGNRLRVDTASQGLTGTQQANAITNLGITATKAELNYVDGVTSAIQTQLDAKLTSSSSLNGSNISSGTVAAARIANLAASKITSGTFDAARIAHNSFHLGATSAETGRTVKETGLYTYEVNNGNLGTGTETGYYEVLTWGEGTGGSVQLAGQWFSGTAPNMYFRTLRDVSDDWTTWQRLLTTSDEGSGNGLDADTLDGSHASAFLTTANYTNGSNNRILTSTSSTGINGEGNLTFDGTDLFVAHSSGSVVFAASHAYDKIKLYGSSGHEQIGTEGSTIVLTASNFKFRDYSSGATRFLVNSSGAITTGTWNGNVIASAYLDSDTAHLSGTQTFSGAKTFSDSVRITGGTKYLYLDNDDESQAGLWFRDNQDQGGQYAKIFFNSGGSNPLSFFVKSSTAVLQLASSTATVNGNIAVSGTVDGRDVASDGSKLDGIESGATADQTASEILTAIKTVDGSGSGLDADTLDGYDSSRFFRRDGAATATVGPGWMTVATNTSGRRAGEILVTDGDSGDHGFIRIHWLRSYADSNFTVINCGGHANRITGVRVLSQDSDNTYGEKVLQVYVEASSSYDVKIFKMGDDAHYTAHTVHTPTIENSITGYSLHGNQLEDLDTYGFAHEEGIYSGGALKVGGSLAVSGTSEFTEQVTMDFSDTGERLYIQWNDTTVGDIGANDTTWLRINQNTAKNIYTPRYIRADGGFFIDGASLGINGTGTLRAENGSAGTPSVSFSSDTNTGFFRQAAEHIGVSLAGAEEFRFDQNGSNGDFHATGDVVAYSTTPSDSKLKKNVKDIKYGLDAVMKLNPKEYDWKKDDRHDIGFIAQEVEEVIPEVVKDKKWFDDKVKTLDYEKLTAVLIKAVQELKAEVEELKK